MPQLLDWAGISNQDQNVGGPPRDAGRCGNGGSLGRGRGALRERGSLGPGDLGSCGNRGASAEMSVQEAAGGGARRTMVRGGPLTARGCSAPLRKDAGTGHRTSPNCNTQKPGNPARNGPGPGHSERCPVCREKGRRMGG